MGIILLTISNVFAVSNLLTTEQNNWLDKNKRTIVVKPQEFEPPFVFTSSGLSKEIKGFSFCGSN